MAEGAEGISEQGAVKFSSGAENQSAGLYLLVNDTPYDPDDGVFLFRQGSSNQIDVKADASILRNNNPRVIVSRVLPDGRKIEESIRFNSQERGVKFDLGPMSAAPEYDYDAGEVFVRGYRLLIHVEDEAGNQIGGWDFEQGLSKEVSGGGMARGDQPPVKSLRMQVFSEGRALFDPKFGTLPLFSLRLGSEVLHNQDDIRILAGLNEGEAPSGLDAVLTITNPEGKEIWRRQLHLEQGAPWSSYPVEASEWPAGDYRVELLPLTDGRV